MCLQRRSITDNTSFEDVAESFEIVEDVTVFPYTWYLPNKQFYLNMSSFQTCLHHYLLFKERIFRVFVLADIVFPASLLKIEWIWFLGHSYVSLT